MLINEYLKLRNQISVTTGNASDITSQTGGVAGNAESLKLSPFAQTLKEKIEEKQQGGVEFSKHAISRLETRNININEGDMLERLNKAVDIAAEKGSSETLVLVDQTAFVVSVKNNKVITTLTKEDLQGNIFTNIDSTVIM